MVKMDYEDVVNEFTARRLNSKTNNFIIIGDYPSDIFSSIPNYCTITLPDNDRVVQAINIVIDMSSVSVQNIFHYVLDRIGLKEQLDFNGVLDLLRFDYYLKSNDIYCQLIVYNIDELYKQEQMLLNELFYYYGENYTITAFTKNNLTTYFLKNGSVLDDREDYQRVEYINLSYQRELKKLEKLDNY